MLVWILFNIVVEVHPITLELHKQNVPVIMFDSNVQYIFVHFKRQEEIEEESYCV